MSAATDAATRRTVRLLSACFALSTTSNVILMSVSALVGYELAVDKSLATLPAALMWVGTAAATVPASFLMRRIGRRLGFMCGALIGVAGAALGYWAVWSHDFALFCLAVAVIGAFNGFNFYFRFAGAEIASEDYRGRAIALVMAGGVVAAIIGPEISMAANGWFPATAYLGPFVAIAGIAMAVFALASVVRIPKPTPVQLQGGRPLGEIVRQPVFVVAALSGVAAYGVMILLMTVTPLDMVMRAHSFDDAAFVIQWHVLAMFAPSFFSGHLIRRFGALTVITWGAVTMLACIGIAVLGVSVFHFWLSLILLGLGWNFLFVGATTLLTETYTTAERAKTQALNEFMVFGCAAVGSYLSGSLHYYLGWEALNLAALPPLLAVLCAALWLDRRRRRAYAAAE